MRPGVDFAVGKMIEEMGELNSALGKTLRWGWASVNPELKPAYQESNFLWVKRGMRDVHGALFNLQREMVELGGLEPEECWIPPPS